MKHHLNIFAEGYRCYAVMVSPFFRFLWLYLCWNRFIFQTERISSTNHCPRLGHINAKSFRRHWINHRHINNETEIGNGTFPAWNYSQEKKMMAPNDQKQNRGKIIRVIYVFAVISAFRGCPRGLMVKAMDCGIVVSEFVLQSSY